MLRESSREGPKRSTRSASLEAQTNSEGIAGVQESWNGTRNGKREEPRYRTRDTRERITRRSRHETHGTAEGEGSSPEESRRLRPKAQPLLPLAGTSVGVVDEQVSKGIRVRSETLQDRAPAKSRGRAARR